MFKRSKGKYRVYRIIQLPGDRYVVQGPEGYYDRVGDYWRSVRYALKYASYGTLSEAETVLALVSETGKIIKEVTVCAEM